jgi:hypothetical protein
MKLVLVLRDAFKIKVTALHALKTDFTRLWVIAFQITVYHACSWPVSSYSRMCFCVTVPTFPCGHVPQGSHMITFNSCFMFHLKRSHTQADHLRADAHSFQTHFPKLLRKGIQHIHRPGRLWGLPSPLCNGYKGLFSWGVKLTTHLHLVPRSRIHGATPPPPHGVVLG